MKPSDLRQHAYTWSSIANSAESHASRMRPHHNTQLRLAGDRMEDAAASIREAIEAMSRAADELEARNAS